MDQPYNPCRSNGHPKRVNSLHRFEAETLGIMTSISSFAGCAATRNKTFRTFKPQEMTSRTLATHGLGGASDYANNALATDGGNRKVITRQILLGTQSFALRIESLEQWAQ